MSPVFQVWMDVETIDYIVEAPDIKTARAAAEKDLELHQDAWTRPQWYLSNVHEVRNVTPEFKINDDGDLVSTM
jgi:hypothetical protein